jgi:hypothetical protein
MNECLEIIFIIAISAVLVSLKLSYGQEYNITDKAATDKASYYLEKIHSLDNTCSYKFQIGETSIMPCEKFILNFNKYMDKLFNESRNEISTILVD